MLLAAGSFRHARSLHGRIHPEHTKTICQTAEKKQLTGIF
jgi:hypothetical protein